MKSDLALETAKANMARQSLGGSRDACVPSTDTPMADPVDDRIAAGGENTKPLILIEFNELCPPLLDRWMAEGRLPNFKAFYDSSQVFVTDSDETDPVNLEPWIQWYSLHTGLPFRDHKVFHLTDGPQAGHRDIWRALLENGKSVGNFLSMNAGRFEAEGSYFVPDPWCTGEAPFPASLGRFHRFIASQVQEHYSEDNRPSVGEFMSFIGFMLANGLRASTVSAILRQLVAERVQSRHLTWKRASILDRLQFDVFRHHQRRYRPDFATFFANSTAHFQHTYWRHMAPEEFDSRPEDDEIARYQDAIFHGYLQMDSLLGQFFDLAGDHTVLALASALSQQPYLADEATGGHFYYRPRDVDALLAGLGIDCEDVNPVMTHQYLMRFGDETRAVAAQAILERVRLEGAPVFECKRRQADSLYFGCSIRTLVAEDARPTMAGENTGDVRFYDLFSRLGHTKSGRHHPDGIFWVRTGRHEAHAEKVSILDVMPTILAHFDIAAKASGTAPLTGRALL